MSNCEFCLGFSSEKEKSFRENYGFFATISLYFCISLSRKKCENVRDILKTNTNFSEKVAKIHQKRLNFENTRLIFKDG